MTTTLLVRRGQMKRKPLSGCHGGVGDLDWTDTLAGQDLKGRRLCFIHDDTLAPGVSVGVHTHHDDEEYYVILSGTGVMTLDDERHDVGPGDVAAVFPGGQHGLENTGGEDMRIIVIGMNP